jgi:acetyltransferase-like isoleucine patch superfamily enzyme
MKKIPFIFLSVILLIIRCADNNTTETPTNPNPDPDFDLKTKLVGTWSNDYMTFYFDEDNNFQESFNRVRQDTIIRDAEIIKGTYLIINEILRFDILEWDVYIPTQNEDSGKLIYESNNFNNSYDISTSLAVMNSKIEINNNVLQLNSVTILTRAEDNSDSLWGSWTSFQWALAQDNQTLNYLFGKINWEYDFDRDSMTATYGARFSIDSSLVIPYKTETLVYNPPSLRWGTLYIYYYNPVEFKDGQLYMFDTPVQPLLPLNRLN